MGASAAVCAGDEHLAARRLGRDARREVHRRAEVVPVALDRAAVMKADANRGGAMATHQVVGDVEPEQDRLPGIGHPQQDRVADRLDVRAPEHRQLRLDRLAEVGDEVCSLLVAVRLRQRGEPRDVGEQERGVGHRKRRNRRAFATTETLENAIAAPASTGFRSPTAASGIAAML